MNVWAYILSDIGRKDIFNFWETESEGYIVEWNRQVEWNIGKKGISELYDGSQG